MGVKFPLYRLEAANRAARSAHTLDSDKPVTFERVVLLPCVGLMGPLQMGVSASLISVHAAVNASRPGHVIELFWVSVFPLVSQDSAYNRIIDVIR